MLVWYVVMATMIYRTTFALDVKTIRRLKNLASHWKVSQAEVLRRALADAEARVRSESDKPNPAALLRNLFASGKGLDPEKAGAYIAEVYEDRKHWRGE
jgi:predicted transcriptional regulator